MANLLFTIIISTLLCIVSGQILTNCKPGYVALAYDDGPFQYTSALIDLLNANKIKATFFVNGRNFWWTDSNPEGQAVIQKAYNSGHQIGSHTWSHKDLTTINGPEFDSEIKNLEDLVSSIIGKKPAFIRPPYGAQNEQVVAKLTEKGYTTVLWSADSKDFETHNIQAEREHIRQAYDRTKIDNGFIILAHDVFEQTTIELTKEIIKYTKQQGFKFTTVADCIGKRPYK